MLHTKPSPHITCTSGQKNSVSKKLFCFTFKNQFAFRKTKYPRWTIAMKLPGDSKFFKLNFFSKKRVTKKEDCHRPIFHWQNWKLCWVYLRVSRLLMSTSHLICHNYHTLPLKVLLVGLFLTFHHSHFIHS